MRLNRNGGFALFLIACGALILLDKVGFGFGWLMGYLIPLAMVGLGFYGVKNGKTFFGWVIMVIGAIILLGKFTGFIGILIAIGLIGYGVTSLKKNATY
ncbi:LiaF transmembrane domain-containing protein [Paenibacillus sp. MBLB4367]|uniref:LiaF transmembrane domain-containing protein n=1 Tax=Paenibacillus sp. MBLB4367 TaxID=3384767 RepID=UPI0039082E9F